MADEQEVGIIFPLAGLETTCEFGRQPPDTAAQGVNVRSFEVISKRSRGGSRCGLTRYINQQVVGDNPVQHLTVLIDPQDPALNGPADTSDPSGIGDYVLDPSTNNTFSRNFGRFVRKFGSGRVPFRVQPAATNYQFVLELPVVLGDGNIELNIIFDDNPVNGDFSNMSYFVFAVPGEPVIPPSPEADQQVWVVPEPGYSNLLVDAGGHKTGTLNPVNPAIPRYFNASFAPG